MTEAQKLKVRQLRTELAFLYGDTRHGGKDHKEEMEAIREQIKAIQDA